MLRRSNPDKSKAVHFLSRASKSPFGELMGLSLQEQVAFLETNLGFIDAKISTKLKSIEDALKKVAAESDNA